MCTTPTLLCSNEPAAGLNARESAALSELCSRSAPAGHLGIRDRARHVGGDGDFHHVVVMDYGVKIAEGTPQAVRDRSKVIAALSRPTEEAIAVMESGADRVTDAPLRSAPARRLWQDEALKGVDLDINAARIVA